MLESSPNSGPDIRTSSGLGQFEEEVDAAVWRMRRELVHYQSAPSTELEDWSKRVRSRLQEIEVSPLIVEDGWLYPSLEARKLAVVLAATLARHSSEAPHIVTSPQGQVVFEWWRDEKTLTLYIDTDGIQYVKGWGCDMDTEMSDGPVRIDQAQGLVDWLNE